MTNQNSASSTKINHHYTVFEKIIKFVQERPFKSRVRIISIFIMTVIALTVIAIFSYISYNKPKVRANDSITELPITSEIDQNAPKLIQEK